MHSMNDTPYLPLQSPGQSDVCIGKGPGEWLWPPYSLIPLDVGLVGVQSRGVGLKRYLCSKTMGANLFGTTAAKKAPSLLKCLSNPLPLPDLLLSLCPLLPSQSACVPHTQVARAT